MITPEEITEDIETSINIASFEFYSGRRYAEQNGLKQTINMDDVYKGTHFIVCCGSVMIKVNPTDFPDIQRREL